MATALPALEELRVSCRTRAFPNHFTARSDLLPSLAALFPRLRLLELRGIGLLQHYHSPHPTPTPPARTSNEEEYQTRCGAPDLSGRTAEGPPTGSSCRTSQTRGLAEPCPGGPGGHTGSGVRHYVPYHRDSPLGLNSFQESADELPAATSSASSPPAPPPALSAGRQQHRPPRAVGLRCLAALSRLEALTLGTVDPPAAALSDLAHLAGLARLRELELDVWLVMTPADELRRLAGTAGAALGRLVPKLRRLTLRVNCCVEEEVEEAAGGAGGRVTEDMDAEGGWAGACGWDGGCDGVGGGEYGAVGAPGDAGIRFGSGEEMGGCRRGSLMTAVLRGMAAVAGRLLQGDQANETRGARQGVPGDGLRMRLPDHELTAADWAAATRVPGLRRLEVGAVAPAVWQIGGGLPGGEVELAVGEGGSEV